MLPGNGDTRNGDGDLRARAVAPRIRHPRGRKTMSNVQTTGHTRARRGAAPSVTQAPESTAALLRELVAHLRQNRTQLREEWARRITESRLLTAMTREEIFAEATSVYDNYVEVLETGSVEALQAYARN